MTKKDAALENVATERRDFLKKMLAGGAIVALPVSTAVVLGEDEAVAQGKGKGKGKGKGGKGKGKGKGGNGKGKGKGKGGGGGKGKGKGKGRGDDGVEGDGEAAED